MPPPSRALPQPFRYLAHLTAGRLLLWCYFLWYLVALVRYFDPDARLWLTSLGMSAIIGIALYISTTSASAVQGPLGFWPTVRLFMMPFCVSSFAALVKGRGFYLVFSPRPRDLAWGFGLCAAFCAATFASRVLAGRSTTVPARVTTGGEAGT
jgi:hypothetical protein